MTLVLAALSLGSDTASGQATTNVPVQDLAYRHVERLVAEGLVDSVSVGQRPYSRRELGRIVAEAERNLSRLESRAVADQAYARRLERSRAVLAVLRAEYGTDGRAGTRVVESGAIDGTWTNSPPRTVPSDELGGISAVTNPFVDYRLGRRYVDGGTLSTTSADLLAREGLDEVYVLAPMAAFAADRPRTVGARLERRWRRQVTRRLVGECQTLSRAGTAVTVLGPGPEDLAQIGANMMDPRRRLAVLETSLRTSRAALTEPSPDDIGRKL